MRHILLGCALAVGLAPMTAWACGSDSECKGDRICVEGTCVDPPLAGGEPASPETGEAETATEVATSGVAIFADIGGLVGYGPSAGVEFGGSLAGFVVMRSLFLGVAPHVIALLEEETVGATSFGIGGGVRVFANGRARRGFFYGGGFELIHWVSHEDGADQGERYYDARYNETSIAAYGQAGYRWLSADGTYMSVGGSAGIGGDLSANTVFADGSEETREGSTLPLLMVNFEVGTFL